MLEAPLIVRLSILQAHGIDAGRCYVGMSRRILTR
jgi:hypothetical protein